MRWFGEVLNPHPDPLAPQRYRWTLQDAGRGRGLCVGVRLPGAGAQLLPAGEGEGRSSRSPHGGLCLRAPRSPGCRWWPWPPCPARVGVPPLLPEGPRPSWMCTLPRGGTPASQCHPLFSPHRAPVLLLQPQPLTLCSGPDQSAPVPLCPSDPHSSPAAPHQCPLNLPHTCSSGTWLPRFWGGFGAAVKEFVEVPAPPNLCHRFLCTPGDTGGAERGDWEALRGLE